MINNKLRELANDSRCLLAVVPMNGGEWIAPIRQNTWKNFASAPMKWDAFNTAQNAADWTHDYTFTCRFMIPKNEHGIIFSAGMADCMFGAYITASGAFYMATNLVKPITSTALYYSYGRGFDASMYGVEHTIKIVIAGVTAAFYIDGVRMMYTTSNLERTTKSELAFVSPQTKFGYLYECTITDDTTGELLWEAPREELWTKYPQPSNIQRNFAIEPAAWQAFAVAYNAIGMNDFQFDLTVVLDSFPTVNKPVFYDAAYGVFGLTVSNNAVTNFYFYFKNLVDGLNFNYVSASKASSAPWYNAPQLEIGENHFRIKRTGTTLEITVNDYVFSVTGSAPLAPSVYRPDVVVSQFGAIVYSQLRVSGKTIWSYPSEAERVRLLTYDNVRTDRGVFEQFDTTKACKISTPFRTGGLTSSLSMLTRISAREQGAGYLFFRNSGNGLNILIASNRLSWEVRFADTQRTITIGKPVAPSFWNGDHIVGMVLDRSNMTFSTIVDDTIESSIIAADVASSQSPLLGLDYAGDVYTNGLADTKISTKWHLVFDRALKPAEIAAISQC